MHGAWCLSIYLPRIPPRRFWFSCNRQTSSLTRSLAHSLTHSLTRSLTHSLTYSLAHSLLSQVVLKHSEHDSLGLDPAWLHHVQDPHNNPIKYRSARSRSIPRMFPCFFEPPNVEGVRSDGRRYHTFRTFSTRVRCDVGDWWWWGVVVVVRKAWKQPHPFSCHLLVQITLVFFTLLRQQYVPRLALKTTARKGSSQVLLGAVNGEQGGES